MSELNASVPDDAYGVVLPDNNLVTLLKRHAKHRAKAIAYTFLKDGEVEDGSLTFEQLDAKAMLIAANLKAHAKRGDRAILLYPSGLDFVTAFFGCIYAGVIAVPSSLPQSRKSNFSRLQSIIDDCDASLVLSDIQTIQRYETGIEALTESQVVKVLSSTQIESETDQVWTDLNITGSDVSFLQYTSGSTGSPKGVMVSHENLMHNLTMLVNAMRQNKDSTFVSWLPLFHDMGLIGVILQSLYVGVRAVFMSPMAFLQKPYRWLAAVSKYRGTITGSPNFAYELCIERITDEQKALLDLSSLTIAYNGAEPIRAATLPRFIDAFAQCGFDERAMYPCYGMAEATLFITGDPAGEKIKIMNVDAKDLAKHVITQTTDDEGGALVNCGRLWGDQQLIIVNPTTQKQLEDGQVGEIWMRGGSVARGYWQREEATKEAFQAYTQCTGEGPFLRSGDFGCIINNELFVTGRLKEVIIVRGTNHYPQDIEITSQLSEPAFVGGGGSAFSVVRNGEEQLVIVQEVARVKLKKINPQEVFENLSAVIAEKHSLKLYGLVLIKPFNLPKTTSGKIQRGLACKLFEENSVPGAFATIINGQLVEDGRLSADKNDVAISVETATDALSIILVKDIAKLMGIEPSQIDVTKPVTTLGLDSLKEVQLQHALQEKFTIELPIECFFDGSSINDIGQLIHKLNPSTEISVETATDALSVVLVNDIAKLMGIESSQIDVTKPVTTLGLDSLKEVQLQHALQEKFTIELPIECFFDGSSINDIGQLIKKLSPSSAADVPPTPLKPEALSDTPLIKRIAKTQSDLLPNQKALCYIQQLAPNSTAYNLTLPVLFPKHTNKAVLIESINSVLAHHGVLNSRFEDEQALIQKIDKHQQPLTVNVSQSSTLALSQCKAFVADQVSQPFDLQKGPICRVELVDVEQGQMMLVFTVHHVVADLWSLQRLLIDLAKFYSANLLELQPPKPLAFDYYDYIEENQQDSTHNNSLDYWSQQLSGTLPILNMPLDFARPVEQQNGGDCFHFTIEATLRNALVDYAKAQQTTLFTVLLAAYQVLLYRYSGQDDVCIGVPTVGRHRKDHAELVGYCVNPVVMRTKLNGEASFEDFLEDVKQTVLGALTHQKLPVQSIIEKINPPRDSSRSPLFQTMFSMLDAHEFNDSAALVIGASGGNVKFGELTFSSIDVPVVASKDDIGLIMALDSERVMGRIDYSTALFAPQTIAQISTHLVELLQSLVDQPTQSVDTINLLTFGEHQSIESRWQQTHQRPENLVFVHQQIAANAVSKPNDVALACNGQQLTYQQLQTHVKCVAAQLLTKSVQPEQAVGVCVERSMDMVVAMLATMQVGAAFVPLDPSYQKNRLDYVIEDAGIEIILSHQPHLNLFDKALMIDLDSIAREGNDAAQAFESYKVTDQQLAYMIYTSGTTGQPKGVMIDHANVKNFFHGMSSTFKDTKNQPSSWLAVTSMSFDISILELLWTLSCGACVQIQAKDLSADEPQPLIDAGQLIRDNNITHLQCTPSFAQVLVEQGSAVNQLDSILVGGEAFPDSLLKGLKDIGVKNIYNMYGPTETTIWSAVSQYDGESESMLIGEPIANTTLMLLDDNLQAAPTGVIGELYIGGQGLARGYKNKPGHSAKQFLPNPWGKTAGERMYRTGDLMRMSLDGRLEFVGRVDNQAKVRGYRIEIDEIEGAIGNFDAVRNVVVAVVDDADTGKKIVAYLELKEKTNDDVVGQLREYLQLHIPAFMVPSNFMVLAALPLTPNGKIDRKQLSQLEVTTKRAKNKPFEKPKSNTEQAICQIWAQLLSTDEVSTQDGFFEIGGHSLMFTDMKRKLSEQLQVKLTIVQLLKYPTINALADFIDNQLSNTVGSNTLQTNNNEKNKQRGANQRMALRNQQRNKRNTKKEAKNGQPA